MPNRRGGPAAANRPTDIDPARCAAERQGERVRCAMWKAQAPRQIVAIPSRQDPKGEARLGLEEAVDHLLHRSIATDGNDSVVPSVGGVQGKVACLAGCLGLDQSRPGAGAAQSLREPRSQALSPTVAGHGVHDQQWGIGHRHAADCALLVNVETPIVWGALGDLAANTGALRTLDNADPPLRQEDRRTDASNS